MSFIQDIWELLYLHPFGSRTNVSSDSLFHGISATVTNCESAGLDPCRDDAAAFSLKLISVASILLSGIAGIAIPLIGSRRGFLRTDGSVFVAVKAFAAGVILATGFVHMLPSGSTALSDPCLPENPWRKFPFPGFFAMMASLVTLLMDFVGTQYYERKQGVVNLENSEERGRVGSADTSNREEIVDWTGQNEKAFGAEEGGGMHIVGIHAHAANHGHNHPHGQDACGDGLMKDQGHVHGHGHKHGFSDDDVEGSARHIVVSQILELGIVSHSVIIGLSLGVSRSPCTIRPLIASLSFHQFFEGFALGGCVSEAKLKTLSTVMMACFFAITTPAGIGVGTAVASIYNRSSPGALIAEGILDSLSAGILVYMALVDLIAADFLSNRMSCNFRLQLASYFLLFLGAGLMSALALWV